MRASEAEKNDGKKLGKTILTSALSVLAAVYVTFHIGSSFVPETEFFAVSSCEFEDSDILSGYVFRDDEAITYQGGSCELFVKNGEKIAAGSIIGATYSAENAECEREIQLLEHRLDALESSALTAEISLGEIDSEIENLTLRIKEARDEGKLEAVSELNSRLEILLYKRSLALSGKRDFDDEAELIRKRIDALRASAGATSDITYENSGYFYSYYDGYEGKLTRAAALGVDAYNYDDISLEEKTNYTNVLGAIITDFRWYFVCKCDGVTAEKYTVGNTYECDFSGGGASSKLTMALEYICINQESGEAVLRFCSGDIPSSFGMERMQKMKVVSSVKRGLCVPKSAVTETDGKKFVYIFKKGIARLREVNVIGERNGLYLVDGNAFGDVPTVEQNDLIIVGEKNLYEGKIVK